MNINRRDFLRYSGIGLGAAGLTLSSSSLPWLIRQAQAAGTPWSFGVMADTQWRSGSNKGDTVGTCATGVIAALNARFIEHGCKFVVQVGDLVDSESTSGDRNLKYRAAAAQPLYDAGIGFWPVRGNHEASATAAVETRALWPQTQGIGDLYGVSDIIDSDNAQLVGLSYAFDFENVRIVLLDQFTRPNGSGNTVADQLTWLDAVLADRGSDQHAFVMAHKNMIGQNHADCLFGNSALDNPTQRNYFISSLEANNVHAFLGGHDHMHHRSIVKSPDDSAAVEQIICASNSYKFYIPKSYSQRNDKENRETVIGHELFTIGYYLFTVDGPCVTVDYYSSSHGRDYGDFDLVNTPSNMVFYLRQRFGYSLNGKTFVIDQGEDYTAVEDTYEGFTAGILAGSNGNNEDDFAGRPLSKDVKTGWSDMPSDAASPILKLWGVCDNLSLYNAGLTGLLPAADETLAGDPIALSLSFDASRVSTRAIRAGQFGLKAKTDSGEWVNAVDRNDGGSKNFVYGPYNASYGLGTYGVDLASRTVWAVVDRDGSFVAK